MIGSLHDLTCEGPVRCTCNPIRIEKPTPKVRERKPLRSKPHIIPTRVREQVLDRDDRTCRWCEVPGGALDLHHTLARSQGGKDWPYYLVAVHRLCHTAIHANPIEARRRGFIVGTGSNLKGDEAHATD